MLIKDFDCFIAEFVVQNIFYFYVHGNIIVTELTHTYLC